MNRFTRAKSYDIIINRVPIPSSDNWWTSLILLASGGNRIAKLPDGRALPGKLFVVEGIDGSGKSTQLDLLRKWLIGQGYCVAFSEWNSSPIVRDTTRRGKRKRRKAKRNQGGK